MAYQAPKSWLAGEDVSAGELNQDLRDNIAFLANPPACRVYNSATQSISNGAITTVTFNSERFDTDSMHSTSTSTNRITFTTAGLYVVGCFGMWGSDTDYSRTAIGIRLNGGTVIAQQDLGNASGFGPGLSVSTVYKFTAAQWVDLFAYQTNTSAGANTLAAEFWATWIGLG